ncbi:zinc ABC transporter substrate-binding protein ZnuA [Chelativorans sp. YIM 93263]|uniref:zinc ABC transporter substrate-binding protein ZnuA n=1 Tax=Chelativorans sp. YIM 93263 TaxID=2906648 RepID=UPI0023792384|nr:zinc ABC transporter substrate-binding protein ZnuA [Chelativorans sp. YIM 93263]
MFRSRHLLLGAATAPLLVAAQADAAEKVVASIKPVHSLVAAVMEGAGTPELLVKGAASPHTYSMRPSEAGMLEDADLVFWVGPGIETFLESSLQSLAGDAEVVMLSETPGLTQLEIREGGAFEAHDHDHGDHAGHDDAGDHDHHDEAHGKHHPEHEDHDHAAHDDDHGHDHAHDEVDTHIWLDPENARVMVHHIAHSLSQADPQNASIYEQNAAALYTRIDTLIAETEEALASVDDETFVVFHDAFHYYENRFGLQAAGSITVSPEVLPGARRLREVQDKIVELGATCVFREPQFEPKLISVVTEGTDARSGVLDPLGADLEDGPDLYFTLIGNLTESLVGCLSADS